MGEEEKEVEKGEKVGVEAMGRMEGGGGGGGDDAMGRKVEVGGGGMDAIKRKEEGEG